MKKNKKAFHYSMNSSVIIVGAIIITLLLNAILVTLNDRFSLEIDFTEDGIYELTDTTKELLDKLESDVEMIMFVKDNQSEMVTMLKTVLGKYTQHSSKLSVSEVNVVKDPSAVTAYDDIIESEKFTVGSLVLKNENKKEFVSSANFVTTDGYSNIERSVTSKLVNFVDGMSLSAITFTSGHGEAKATSTETVLETDAYRIETLDTLTQDFPSDKNSLVVINAPKNDFSAEEIEKLDAYLDRGGNVMIAFDPQIDAKLERLESYLAADWGIIRSNNIVVDQKQQITGTPYSILQFTDHDIVKPVKEESRYVVTSFSNSLEIAPEVPQSVTVKEVLTTTQDATETNIESLYGGVAMPDARVGKFNVMVAASRDNYIMEDNKTFTGHLVVCGSESMFNSVILESRFANEDVFLNAINWMKGSDSGISVRIKRMPGGSLTISQGHFWTWFVVLIVVVPLGLLISGLVIWLKRRYK
ncbi:MAG: GldG family protein [Clostridia bacterium]|nr:GldG family protein [Clostridia bacterium]